MKKLSLIIVTAAFISLVACKKDRTCTCTTNSIADKTTYVKVTKRQGMANCVSYTTDNGNGTSTKTDCVLSK